MKTTDLLTFFQPEESSGKASTFSIQASDGPAVEVWVFAREKVSLSRFANVTVSSEDDRRNIHLELQGLLQLGGGLLIYARPHNDVVRVQMLRFEGLGYVPPKRMLCLSLCGDSRFEDIAGSVDLEIGDHLVLPVNHQAEARLSALCNDLKGLPSDLESSVLNIIRRPSLEWRLDRIERTLSLLPATQADQRRSQVRQGNFLERLYGFFMWKLPIGPVVSAALVLMAGVLLADHWPWPSSQNTDQATTTTSESAGTNSDAGKVNTVTDPPPAPPKVEPKDFKSSLAALLGALKVSNKAGVKELYRSHFKDHQNDPLGTPDISWGITKLQALKLGFIASDNVMLSDRSKQTAAKKAYKNENLALELNETATLLLAYTWCLRGNNPELPATDDDSQPLPLPTQLRCDQITLDKAIPGIKALTDWVTSPETKATK
jgi:hypothetical protein